MTLEQLHEALREIDALHARMAIIGWTRSRKARPHALRLYDVSGELAELAAEAKYRNPPTFTRLEKRKIRAALHSVEECTAVLEEAIAEHQFMLTAPAIRSAPPVE